MGDNFEHLQITGSPVVKALEDFRQLDRDQYHVPNTSSLFQVSDSDLDKFLWKLETIYRESPAAIVAIFHTDIYNLNLTDNTWSVLLDMLNDGKRTLLLTKFVVISYYRSEDLSLVETKDVPREIIANANRIISLLTANRQSNIETRPFGNPSALETSENINFADAASVIEIISTYKPDPQTIAGYLSSCLDRTFGTAVLETNIRTLLGKAKELSGQIDSEEYYLYNIILYVLYQAYPFRSADSEYTPELQELLGSLVEGGDVTGTSSEV